MSEDTVTTRWWGRGNGNGGGGGANVPLRGSQDPHGPGPEPEGLTLRDYLGVLWRRKWIIALVVVVATASAYYFSARQAAQYAASASMIYETSIDLANPLTGQAYMDTMAVDREMASIGDVMASPDMQERADTMLAEKGVDTSAGYSVSATPQSSDSSSTSAGSSNVVLVNGDSTDPKLAAAAANAYTLSFVAWSKERQRGQIDKAMDVVKSQLAKYQGAAKETGDYILLKQRLTDLDILYDTASGNYRVLAPATVPGVPYAPNPLRSAILGFAVGLFAGIGLAFLLEQFDTRLRQPEEIAAILRQPILGRIPKISGKLLHEQLPVTLTHPTGHIAEAFRMVRTNLDFMAVDNDVRSMAITSCLQGEGKSISLANLAITMALAGKKVVVVDADLRRPRQHKFFRLENEAGLSTVVAGRSTLRDSLQPVDVQPPDDGQEAQDFVAWSKSSDALLRLYVLPSGPIPPNPGEIVASRRFADVIQQLQEVADIVLVDTPAMLAVGDTSTIAASVDSLLFLVDMHLVKKPQLATAAAQLSRLPVMMLGVVVRMYGGKGSRYEYAPYYYKSTYAEDGSKVKERRRRKSDRAPGQDRAGV